MIEVKYVVEEICSSSLNKKEKHESNLSKNLKDPVILVISRFDGEANCKKTKFKVMEREKADEYIKTNT